MGNNATMFFVTSKEDADKLTKLGFHMIDHSSKDVYTFLNDQSINFSNIKVTYTNHFCI